MLEKITIFWNIYPWPLSMFSYLFFFRMSLQFDPDFVADQVVILEAGLQEMGERFLATSQKIGILNTALIDKNAQLRSASR